MSATIERVRLARVAVLMLLGGCFTELTVGNYKMTGPGANTTGDRAWVVGVSAGLRLDYARWIRAGAGAAMNLGFVDARRGHIKPRTLGTMVRGDISLVNGLQNRIRATGGLEFAGTGNVPVHYMEGATFTGSAKTSGWFAGLSGETTHLSSGLTAQLTLGVHSFDLDSDVVDDAHFIGPQVRMTYTYFPEFRQVSPGFASGMLQLIANHWTPSSDSGGSCIDVPVCYREAWGAKVCREVPSCN